MPAEISTTPARYVRRRRRNAWLYATGIPLVVIALIAFTVPILWPVDLGATDLRSRLVPPIFIDGGSWTHPLGTDQLGRDLAMRLIYATRETLNISFAGMLIASAIGTTLGLISGLWGARADAVISFIVDVRLSLPGIVITTAAMAFFGSTSFAMILIIGLTGWAGFARIVRGELLVLREKTFIDASRAIGASRGRVVGEHVLINIASAMIVNAVLQLNGFILLESSLSFLGLGVQPPGVSLGLLVAQGREYLLDAWWLSMIPSLVITLILLLITLLGDWLRDRLDPKLTQH